MLTDTTFWIDLGRERQRRVQGPATAFINKHRSYRFSISIVTWGELAAGFEHVADLERFLRRVTVHFVPLQVAWEASRIERAMSAAGERLGENDNWIAATALAFGLRLVTRDEGFRRVPRLNLVTY